MAQQQRPPRRIDQYPAAIRAAGPNAIRVFDRVERGLIEQDGFSQDEADMLLQINLDQILTQAAQEAKEEAAADKRRARAAKAARAAKQQPPKKG